MSLAIQDIKQKIWKRAKQDIEKVNQAMKISEPNDNSYKFWQRVYKNLLTPKPRVGLTPEQYQRFCDLKYKYEQVNFPTWIKDGHFLKPENPNTADANQLQDYIVKFLTWSGHYATRINVQGVPIIKDGKVDGFRPTSTKKGQADVRATINGRSVQLEVKVGRDRPSEDQLKVQRLERKAGGVYEFIHNADEFLEFYDNFTAPK